MNQGEIAAIMKGIAPVLRDAITTAIQPVIYRLIALESREPAQGEAGTDGKDADPEVILAAVKSQVEKAVAALPSPKDGTDGKDGDDGNDGADAYPGEAKGLYNPEAEYRALDVVSFNGCEWRAKSDAPG